MDCPFRPQDNSGESPRVSDGVTKSVIRSQKVSTKLDNAPPVIKEIIVPENVFAGDSLELSAEVDDADGDALTYHWVVSKGELDSDTTEHPTWTAPIDEGTIIISLTVNDGLNEPTTEIHPHEGNSHANRSGARRRRHSIGRSVRPNKNLVRRTRRP